MAFPRAFWLKSSLFVTTVLLSSCQTHSPTLEHQGPTQIVASTQAWGLVAEMIAGDKARVKTIVGAGKNAHEYELTAQDSVSVNNAEIALLNGSEYDEFMVKALRENSSIHQIRADHAQIVSHGLEPRHHKERDNQHLFFNFAVVDAVAGDLAEELSNRDPLHKEYFDHALSEFHSKLHTYVDQLTLLSDHHAQLHVIQTESVAQYLLHYLDAIDVTPEGYRNAIDKEIDPALADQAAVMTQLRSREANILVYNEQDLNSSTQQVIGAAETGGVPIIAVGETPTENEKTYDQWIKKIIGSFVTQLGGPALPSDYHHHEESEHSEKDSPAPHQEQEHRDAG